MRIDSFTVRNYRCINEIKLDKVTPVTVLVGRNNTGKSALIEAMALASSAKSGWFDAIGGDLIETIVEGRGGFDYADLMIRIGSNEAEFQTKGRGISGTIRIAPSIKDLGNDASSIAMQALGNYVGNAYDAYISPTYRSWRSRELPRTLSTRDSERVKPTRKILQARREALRQIKACVAYYSEKKERPETAAIFGTVSERDLDSDLYELLPDSEIIRSHPTRQIESRTIFSFPLDLEFIAEVQRYLARSGQLIRLIKSLRRKVPYFKDIREVDEDFLVYVKGLRKPVPLQSMGDGFSAQLALLMSISIAKGGIALIEEPEGNLHPGYMSLVANRIAETANDVQYILSTHNSDFLGYLLEASSEVTTVVRMYRIEETAQTDYEVLTGEEAKEEIEDLKMDLRGP